MDERRPQSRIGFAETGRDNPCLLEEAQPTVQSISLRRRQPLARAKSGNFEESEGHRCAG